MDNITREIIVTFQKEGIHAYPEAATNPDLQEVAFLSFPHRHIFHFRVAISVTHDNRDLEFILIKRELENFMSVGNIDNASCEMLAMKLIVYIQKHYPNRSVVVEVFEDGENGARLTYDPGH